MTESIDDEVVLKQLNAELAEAEVKRDTGGLARILADDYLGVDPSGSLLTREKILTTYAEGSVQLESIVTSDLHIRIMGDMGIVTGRSLIKGRTTPGEFHALFRYTDVYRKRDGDWKLVSSQLTPMVTEIPIT